MLGGRIMSEVVKHSVNKFADCSLTDEARNRILSYLQENNYLGMRLSVKKVGCSGLSYVIEYVSAKTDSDITVIIKDPFFLSIDKKSYPYLKGVKIDYVKQGINSKFIYENPNQTGQCGCGESFTVDD